MIRFRGGSIPFPSVTSILVTDGWCGSIIHREKCCVEHSASVFCLKTESESMYKRFICKIEDIAI